LAGQALLQAPQFVGSVLRSTHTPLQTVWAELVHLQTPATQACPPPQALPQVPQFEVSVAGSTQT
jgi:hypothetical protein